MEDIASDALVIERLDDLVIRMIAALDLAVVWLSDAAPPEVRVELESVIAEARAEL